MTLVACKQTIDPLPLSFLPFRLVPINCFSIYNPSIIVKGNNVCEVPVRETNLPGGQQRYNYVGMTATSLHCRMLSHREGQRRKYRSNVLYRHDLEVHSGVKQTYEARILVRE